MRKPTIPTFYSTTKGAHAKDTIHGACAAFCGALIAGLALGTLGAPGVAVALVGIMLAAAGLGLMFQARPIDRTLYRAAVALQFAFACPIVKVRHTAWGLTPSVVKAGSAAKPYRKALPANWQKAPPVVVAKLTRDWARDANRGGRAPWLTREADAIEAWAQARLPFDWALGRN